METKRKLFVLRPFFLIAIFIGILGGCAYEWIWRTHVVNGEDTAQLTDWIKKSPPLIEKTGAIYDVHIERIGTTFSIGDGFSGRYHFSLATSVGGRDIWVAWHEDGSSKSVRIDKMEMSVNGVIETLWKARR
jgi:hypothetical protein